MDYDKLELKLRKIVEKRLSEGWNVRPVGYGNGRIIENSCCAFGAVWIEYGKEHATDMADHLGLKDWMDILSIEAGFENEPWRSRSQELFEIGARIRERYVDDNGQVE
jgi:hypothetical protein